MTFIGIIEEMLDDTMGDLEDTEEMEEAVQTEVDKVLWEITEGKLGEAPLPPVGDTTVQPETTPQVPEEEEEEDLEEMQSRLAALRS